MSLDQTGELPVYAEDFLACSLNYDPYIKSVAEVSGFAAVTDDRWMYGDGSFGYQMGFDQGEDEPEITVVFCRVDLTSDQSSQFLRGTYPNNGNDLAIVAYSFTESFMADVRMRWAGQVRFLNMNRTAPWFTDAEEVGR